MARGCWSEYQRWTRASRSGRPQSTHCSAAKSINRNVFSDRYSLSRAILRWLAHEQIETALIDPGKPWQNGTNESFNGKFRDECLSMEWFRNRVDAKIVIENWRRHYNEVRPHSSLANLTPIQFKQQLSQPRLEGTIF